MSNAYLAFLFIARKIKHAETYAANKWKCSWAIEAHSDSSQGYILVGKHRRTQMPTCACLLHKENKLLAGFNPNSMNYFFKKFLPLVVLLGQNKISRTQYLVPTNLIRGDEEKMGFRHEWVGNAFCHFIHAAHPVFAKQLNTCTNFLKNNAEIFSSVSDQVPGLPQFPSLASGCQRIVGASCTGRISLTSQIMTCGIPYQLK